MGVIVKASTAGTTNLSATAAWVGSVLPVGADIAVWDASSLTGTQTLAANPTWGAIRADTIAGNLTISPSGASRILTLQGYLDGGEEFLVDMSSAASGRSILLLSASGFTATLAVGVSATAGVIDVSTGATFSALGSPITGSRLLVKRGGGSLTLGATNTTTTAWTSPIDFQSGFIIVGSEGATLANYATGNGTITMSAGTTLQTGNPASGNTRYFSNPIVVNGDVTLGAGGAGATGSTGFKGTSFALGATTKTLTIAGPTIIESAITGTAGFTKAGAGTLTVSGSLAGLSGTLTFDETTSNLVTFNSASVLSLAANTTINVTGPANYGAAGNRVVQFLPNSAAFSLPATFAFSGTGAIFWEPAVSSTGAGASFAAGAMAALTGVDIPSTTGFLAPAAGFSLSSTSSTTVPNTIATVKDLPSLLSFYGFLGSATANTRTLYYDNVGSTHNYATRFDVVTGSTGAAALTASIYANQASGPLVLTGEVRRYETTGQARTATLALRGSTLGVDNTISGNITQPVPAGFGSGVLALTKADANKWILSGANTYTGTTSISAGTLSAQNATAFGGSGAVTQTGGTIEVTGGTALNKAGAALTLVSAAGANALTTTTGTNTLACAGITLSSTIIVDAAAGASLTVNNTAAMSGAFGVTKNNSGEIGLGTFANTYTGAVTINSGTLTVGNLQNTSTASSLGTGALSSAIALTGTLKYNGTGHSTNRSLTFTGSAPALDASGSGAVTYSAATQAAGARTITFTGSSTAANTLSAALSDGTGTVSVAKSGAGKWVLSNATLNYTGTTSCAGGTLNLGSTNRTLSGALSISDGTIENSTNTISANTTMTGGTITAELTGNKTLDVNSGSAATLQPTNNANTFSGATTVAAGGILRLITAANPTTAGAGLVLGTSAVSVSGDIKTSATGAQRGQMRYGGNLTFNAGAKLYVGGA